MIEKLRQLTSSLLPQISANGSKQRRSSAHSFQNQQSSDKSDEGQTPYSSLQESNDEAQDLAQTQIDFCQLLAAIDEINQIPFYHQRSISFCLPSPTLPSHQQHEKCITILGSEGETIGKLAPAQLLQLLHRLRREKNTSPKGTLINTSC